MIISRKRVSYFLYLLIVIIVFVDFNNSLPLIFAGVFNKSLYVISIFFIIINARRLLILLKDYTLPLGLLFGFSCFYMLKSFYHGEKLFAGIATAVFYFFMFVILFPTRMNGILVNT